MSAHPWFVTSDQVAKQNQARLLADLEDARKAAECDGVTINGIRYAGSPDNRAAISEALKFAQAAKQTTFAMWKDSDGHWHADHPVSDVEQALMAIGQRRGALIALEGQYQARVITGEIESTEGLAWEV